MSTVKISPEDSMLVLKACARQPFAKQVPTLLSYLRSATLTRVWIRLEPDTLAVCREAVLDAVKRNIYKPSELEKVKRLFALRLQIGSKSVGGEVEP